MISAYTSAKTALDGQVISRASIDLLDRAVVAPLTTIQRERGKQGTFDGGVHYSDLSICLNSLQVKNSYKNIPRAIQKHPEQPILAGRHIFCGLLHDWHFGHFITESISRLWATKELSADYESLIFYTRFPGKQLPKFAQQLIASIGWRGSITLIREPTTVEHVAVPASLCHSSLGYVYGHPLVRKLFAGTANKIKEAPSKIYVSRSRLKADDGLIVCESLIEDNLTAEGYTIFHPQEHPIQRQLDILHSADKIIFAEGSPIHLFAYICRPEQQAYVIWRRRVMPVFLWQIASFGGPVLSGTPCIEGLWLPENLGDPTQRAKTIIDFSRLRDDLYISGFIQGKTWKLPNQIDIEDHLASINNNSRFDYRYKATCDLQ